LAEAWGRAGARYLWRVTQTEKNRARAKLEIQVAKRELHQIQNRERYLGAGGTEREWRRNREGLVAKELRRQTLEGREHVQDELRSTGRYKRMF
jgi:hypothetical protein